MFRDLRPQYCSIYDPYFWSHERYWKLSWQPLILDGTPFKSVVWRLLGVRIGRRVFDDGCVIMEKSLVSIGADCTLGVGSIVQPHSQESGTFKSDRIAIGAGCTLGIASLVHYGATIGDGAALDPDSFLMKGEEVPPHARWGGNPARAAFLTVSDVKRNDAVHGIQRPAQTGTDPSALTPPHSLGTQPSPTPAGEDGEQSSAGSGALDIEQHAFDRLSSYVIENFAGHKMSTLVAAVLEAEGFTCKVFPEGADQGVDILAGKGPLGLDEPRLVVHAKCETTAVGSPVVQELLAAMNTHQAQQGLVVAWGGVTKPAERLLSSQYLRARAWSSKDLLDAVFRNYERLPEEIHKSLPLKRVWALVEESG